FRSVVHCAAPAKVRIQLLLETGSKPREKRLVLPVFPFLRLRGSTFAYAAHRSTPRAERRRVGGATGSRGSAPEQGLLRASTLLERVSTRSTTFLGRCHEHRTCFRRTGCAQRDHRRRRC